MLANGVRALGDPDGKSTAGATAWWIGPEERDPVAPSKVSSMVNYRAEDLHALVWTLKAEGCDAFDRIEDSEHGKFAWVIDPEGNKVGSRQPPAVQ